MKFLLEKEHKYKYYAVNPDCANWYDTLDEVKRDLMSFVPYGQESLPYEERITVYSLTEINKDPELDEGDLGYDDIVFEFYDNKIHYAHSDRVVDYKEPKPKEKKEYSLQGSDGLRYKVKAFTKAEAVKALKDYLNKKV